MTTKLIPINTDTHVVVPREPDDRMLTAVACCSNDNVPTGGSGNSFRKNIFKNEYAHAIAAAPQLTTPPVLRWEGRRLFLGHCSIAYVLDGTDEWYAGVLGEPIGKFATEQKAILAAEKALGLPIVEEV